MASRSNKKRRRRGGRSRKERQRTRPKNAASKKQPEPPEIRRVREILRERLEAGETEEDLVGFIFDQADQIAGDLLSKSPALNMATGASRKGFRERIQKQLQSACAEEVVLHKWRQSAPPEHQTPEFIKLIETIIRERDGDHDVASVESIAEEVRALISVQETITTIAQGGYVGDEALAKEFHGKTMNDVRRVYQRVKDLEVVEEEEEAKTKLLIFMTNWLFERQEKINSKDLPISVSLVGRDQPASMEDFAAILRQESEGLSSEERTFLGEAIENYIDQRIASHERGEDEEDPPMDFAALVDEIRKGRFESTNFVKALSSKPGEVDKPQEYTVRNYMMALQSAFELTRNNFSSNRQQRDAIALWTCLKEARVFHIGRETFGEVYREADRYTTTEIAGQEFHLSRRPLPEEETKHFMRAVTQAAREVPYPEKFPFPSVFLGYGRGVRLSNENIFERTPEELRGQCYDANLLGHLMTDDGLVYAIFMANGMDEDVIVPAMWFNPIRYIGYGWPRSTQLDPWILNTFIDIINDHRTFVLETSMNRRQRTDFKRDRKKMGLKGKGHTPPPYYTLRMKSKLIKSKVRKANGKPRGPIAYRTDRRAHERCYIRKGKLPIDPEVAAKLKKQEYTIFTHNPPDAETLRRLMERGLPYKRADEWLAIKIRWIEKGFTSNDDSLPYIPAVRKLGDVAPSTPRQPTRSWADDPGA